jgi:hypothetical protein
MMDNLAYNRTQLASPDSPPVLDVNIRVDQETSEPPNTSLNIKERKNLSPPYSLYRFTAVPSNWIQADDDYDEPLTLYDYNLDDFNFTHSATVCVQQHGFDSDGYKNLSTTTLRIIWMVWLPSNGHGRNIFLGQLYHLMAPHGLLYRPNTKLYIALLTDSYTEENWFYNLEVIKRPFFPLQVFQTSDNAYEFFAIRWLWELSCSHPDDIYLYFHSKGASYAGGNPQYIGNRSRDEVILSRQHLRPWRSILAIFASTDQPTISWTGGKMNWYNFFWARGQHLRHLMKPVRTTNRYWYEMWNGRMLKGTQCDGSYDLQQAVSEQLVNTSRVPFEAAPDGKGQAWHWYSRSFYSLKMCAEYNGEQHQVIQAILEPGWTPPSCAPEPGPHCRCNLQEH